MTGVLMLATSIAIWNRDKIIVTIAVGVWGINVVLLIQSESHRPLSNRWNFMQTWSDIRCRASEYLPSKDSDYLDLQYASAGPLLFGSRTGYCLLLNVQIIKLNFISTLITDIVLLLVMLIGLLRLRLDGGGMLSLGRILWKQVGWLWFSL
jgi:hypothetical protein